MSDTSNTPPNTAKAAAFSRRMQAHRSIRRYRSTPLDSAFIDGLLAEAWAGTSSSGNLNMVSVVKTVDVERKARLFELHLQQPMVLQAPLVLTFCADSHCTRAALQTLLRERGFLV